MEMRNRAQTSFKLATAQVLFAQDNFSREDLTNALYIAYFEARKAKRRTRDEVKFEFNLAINIERLADSILSRKYRPSRSIAFMISRPVQREIFAAPFRDRVVHHLLFMLCGEWWDRRFIGNSFSCRTGKGTIYGREHLRKDMRRCSRMGREPGRWPG